MKSGRPGSATMGAARKKAKAALPAVPHPIIAGILERIDAEMAAMLAVQQTILEIVQTINRKETQQLQKETDMSAQLDNLKVKVAANTTVIQSAITFINGLAQALRDARDDPAAIDALATELETRDQELSGALVTNTPAAPPA